jgi:hypothetical protein
MVDAAARNVSTVVVYSRFRGSPIVKHDTSLENVTVNRENCKLISKLTVAELFSYFIHSPVILLLWATEFCCFPLWIPQLVWLCNVLVEHGCGCFGV